MTDTDLLLDLRGVTKTYGGALALDGVDLTVRHGEVHALLGENGAGKSTLSKIVAGAVVPDAGTILVEGREVAYRAPADAALDGISIVYQETSLVDSMTVAQNLFLGSEARFNRLGRLNLTAQRVLAENNFVIDPTVRIAELSAAQKQMVEIARALHRAAKLVILDEPTASITALERQQLLMSMSLLKARGVGIIFITHNLEEALDNADRITVMRDGKLVATRDAADLTRDALVRHMVGRAVEYEQRLANRAPDPKPALEVDSISVPGSVRSMSFSAYGGEVTAIAGLIGSGRSEMAEAIFGAFGSRYTGTVRVDGKLVRNRTPRAGVGSGISYITEDRKVHGIFPDLTIVDNLYLGSLGAERFAGPLTTKEARQRRFLPVLTRFNVRALRPTKARLVELSGGNQQKVVLAKALSKVPRVAIFDEPTRGVDVGSIADIHAIIREFAELGVAVILISSYLPEVLALGDRILVARSGRIVTELSREQATEETIMFAATE